MILGLRLAGCAFDPELLETRAQPRERPLVQEAGEIIRTIWEKFPAPEADEEVEIFTLDALDIGPLRRVRERRVRQSERARIAAKCGETLQQRGIRRACKQDREQRIFLRACRIDLVDIAGRARMLRIEVGPQHCAAHAGGLLDRQHAVGRNAGPTRNGRRENANSPREPADAAGNADRFLQSYVPHRRFSYLIYFSSTVGTYRPPRPTVNSPRL